MNFGTAWALIELVLLAAGRYVVGLGMVASLFQKLWTAGVSQGLYWISHPSNHYTRCFSWIIR